MFVADVGRIAALPTRYGVNVVQRISMNFGEALLECCNEFKPTWYYPDFFPGFTNKSIVEALPLLNVPSNYIPMAGPCSFRGRTQTVAARGNTP